MLDEWAYDKPSTWKWWVWLSLQRCNRELEGPDKQWRNIEQGGSAWTEVWRQLGTRVLWEGSQKTLLRFLTRRMQWTNSVFIPVLNNNINSLTHKNNTVLRFLCPSDSFTYPHYRYRQGRGCDFSPVFSALSLRAFHCTCGFCSGYDLLSEAGDMCGPVHAWCLRLPSICRAPPTPSPWLDKLYDNSGGCPLWPPCLKWDHPPVTVLPMSWALSPLSQSASNELRLTCLCGRLPCSEMQTRGARGPVVLLRVHS